MRKYPILAFVICMIFIVSILTASSESTIVDSMLFQGEGTVLSLDKAIDTALKGNASIIKSEMALEQAEVSYEKSKSETDKIKEFYNKIDKQEDSMDYMQNVTLPMMNIDLMLESAQVNLDALKTGQKSAVEQLYFSLRQAEKQCEIQKENLEISKALYDKSKKKFELGLVAKQEVLNGELNVLNAEVGYNSALNSLTKLKMSLNNMLGFDLMNELVLKDELSYKAFEVESIAKVINDAFANSSSMKALDLTYKIEALKLEITGRQFPEGTYVYDEQEIKVDKALKDMENEQKSIELEVRENYLDVMQKQDEIRSGEKSVELAEEMFKLSQTTYDAGLGLLTDVQGAQLSLQQKKLALSKAILDYNIAVMKFNDSIGVE